MYSQVVKVCRLWNLSATAFLVLTFYNIFLTLKFMYDPNCSRNVIQVHNPPEPQRNPCPLKPYNLVFPDPDVKLDLGLGRLDNSLKYKYFDHFWVGERFAALNTEFSVCLATQSSLDRLYSIVQVAERWSGPISLAIFVVGEEELEILILYLTYIRQCYGSIRDRVSFHLALPKNKIPKAVDIEPENVANMDCSKPEATLKTMLKHVTTPRWNYKNGYPQNHMRNLARKNCQAKYVYLTDVDIIPSQRQAEELNKFLQGAKCKSKCAYVIPTYELDERVVFPANKSELVRLAKKGLARPFHQKLFVYNQHATNFTKWQDSMKGGNEVHISHPVTNFEFLYEPFYVALDDAPPHDERFEGYGYTRNTQVYEMYVAGYEFLVLSPAFSCHWGLQSKRAKPTWREQQNSENRKKFERFKKEVFARYGRDPLKMLKPKRAGR